MSAWATGEEETARVMWLEGKSASEIGMAISKTRNQVLGVANRRKWGTHASRVPKINPDWSAKKKAEGKNFSRNPTRRERIKTKTALRSPLGFAVDMEVKDADLARLRSKAWEPLPGSAPVPLIDHKRGCKWPVGEAPILFCAEPSEVGHVYCATHERMAENKRAA